MTLHIHCDGSCYHIDGRMGMGIAFFYEDSEIPFHTLKVTGDHLGTNNEAEYLAIKAAVSKMLILEKNISGAVIYSDSECVINQLKGLYQINKYTLLDIYNQIMVLLKYMGNKPVEFVWVPRTHPRQKIVDKLSKQANPYFKK